MNKGQYETKQGSNGLVYDDRNDKFSSETINKIASINEI